MRRAEAVTISAFIAGKPRKASRSTMCICDPVTGKQKFSVKKEDSMKNFVPKGIIPAMVTPIRETGEINEGALRKLTNHLIDGGSHGLFPVGSQGEFFSLTF